MGSESLSRQKYGKGVYFAAGCYKAVRYGPEVIR